MSSDFSFMESIGFEQQVLFRGGHLLCDFLPLGLIQPEFGLEVNLSLDKNSRSISRGYTCLSGNFFLFSLKLS